jgi:SAM-dependent methyltransferase
MTIIFDIEKIKSNRDYALTHMQGHDFLFEKAASRLIDDLKDITREYHNILVIGVRGFDFIKDKLSHKNIVLFDIDDNLNEIPQFENASFDCVIALPYLHSVNDVQRFLLTIKSLLKPDGFFLCSFFGGRSLQELRQAITQAELDINGGVSNHIHPMIDHYQFASLMQNCGFALPVIDYDRVVVSYQNLDNLYKDLKNMGEGNALLNRNKNIKNINYHIENIYKNNFYDKGFTATFDIIYGIGWAPHESQPKPAKRGSGQMSLTEIL